MSSRRVSVLLCITAGLALACVAGLAFLAFRLPLAHRQARQRWEQRGPRHYEAEVVWASGWSYGHVRAEVRDNQIVAAVDADTGQPLERSRFIVAGFYSSIDSLFGMIDAQIQPASTWRYQLARYHPLLANWIYRCTALLPRIEYDPDLGYPASIDYYGNPCFNGSQSVLVKIKRLRPLPCVQGNALSC